MGFELYRVVAKPLVGVPDGLQALTAFILPVVLFGLSSNKFITTFLFPVARIPLGLSVLTLLILFSVTHSFLAGALASVTLTASEWAGVLGRIIVIPVSLIMSRYAVSAGFLAFLSHPKRLLLNLILILLGIGISATNGVTRVADNINSFAFADAILLTMMPVVARMSQSRAHGSFVMAILFSETLLFISGVRGIFISFNICLALMFVLQFGKKRMDKRGSWDRKMLFLLLVTSVFSLPLTFFSSGFENLVSIAWYRLQEAWHGGFIGSSSGTARIDLLLVGIKEWFSSPVTLLVGNFGYEYALDRPGGYVHSILGVAPQFGIVLFIVLAWIVSYILIRQTHPSFWQQDRYNNMALWIGVCFIVDGLLFRGYIAQTIWFAVGIGIFSLRRQSIWKRR